MLLAPAALQATAMVVDEGWCHRRRHLGRWERVGHPIDTLSVVVCYVWISFTPPATPHALLIYVGLAMASCLLITKDEPVHARTCDGLESWLHAVLFVLHPIVFMAFGLLWCEPERLWIVRTQLALTLSFATYQTLYWSIPWHRDSRRTEL